MPLSVFANAEYVERTVENPIDDEEFSAMRVMAGLKVNFGSETLLDRDRSGATLNPYLVGADTGLVHLSAP
jgi:hypothetical protein